MLSGYYVAASLLAVLLQVVLLALALALLLLLLIPVAVLYLAFRLVNKAGALVDGRRQRGRRRRRRQRLAQVAGLLALLLLLIQVLLLAVLLLAGEVRRLVSARVFGRRRRGRRRRQRYAELGVVGLQLDVVGLQLVNFRLHEGFLRLQRLHLRRLGAEWVGPPFLKDCHLEFVLIRAPVEFEDVAHIWALYRNEQGPLADTVIAVIETAKIDHFFSVHFGPEDLTSGVRVARRRLDRVPVGSVRHRARREVRWIGAAC
eukprot:scaffold13207_cov62-Phaeocystis_antarctica.AAC.1